MLPQQTHVKRGTGERQCKDTRTQRTKGDTLQEKWPKESHDNHPSERVASVKVAVSAGGKQPATASKFTDQVEKAWKSLLRLLTRVEERSQRVGNKLEPRKRQPVQTPNSYKKKLVRKQRMVRQLQKKEPTNLEW